MTEENNGVRKTSNPKTKRRRKKQQSRGRKDTKQDIVSSGTYRKIKHNERKEPYTGSKSKRTKKNDKSLKLTVKIMSLFMALLFYIFTMGIILTSVLFAFSDSEDKNLFGYRVLAVLTDSMSPQEKSPSGGFYAGDVIIVKDIPGDDAKVGDILTFHPNIDSKTFLTHRVVKKMDTLEGDPGPFYITKGDANNTEDVPIHSKQVVGKTVFVLPKIGSVIGFVRENFVISTIFVISLFGFIVVMRMYFFSN